MWVPKIPKRFDFCGRPPCGLCFDWIEPAPPPPVFVDELAGQPLDAPVEELRVDGMTKVVEDILGKDVVPTEDQKDQIRRGIEYVHLKNLDKIKVTPECAQQDTIDESWTRRSVEGFLDQKRKEAAVVRPRVDTRPTLDEIADRKEKEEGKKEAELVPTRTSQQSKSARDAMFDRERQRLEEARLEWERTR